MIYLDNHATTACDPRVIESMVPFYTTFYGNASSNHLYGEIAANAVNEAEKKIYNLINGQHGTLVFTSGATESNNIVLIGLAQGHYQRTGKKGKIVTTGIEHKAILSPLSYLENDGWQIEYLPIDITGTVDLEKAREIIDQRTVLVSVQLANSEIGTIQPIKELAALSHRAGAFFHSDAAQAVGKISVDVADSQVDLLTFSAHKLYGPKGVGAIWINQDPDLLYKLQPIMFGGESGSRLRPGTLPVPLVVAFGEACAICAEELKEGTHYLSLLRDHFESLLKAGIPDLLINGNLSNRLPNNSNLTFPDTEADLLLANLPEIVASTGSACESGSIEPSRVLLAIGVPRDDAFNTLRIGLGRFNTISEIEIAAKLFIKAYTEAFDVL
ncbi:cysteine desulfurase [Mucilaginibacter corticis]|uniref:cysteine desulfurase n=1 Tax=Mucilaginibacter corticis TaxID=2597670 RepID=A0A556M9J2_9SPHI|nr:cysteine desulfurase family protein [Mucilaginibacter corticis]TSJ36584.1 cysteine desulfurase [Mucilaginibacter corticis]